MRRFILLSATTSVAIIPASGAVAQTRFPVLRPVQIAPQTPPKTATVIPSVNRDVVKIAPVVAPPALRNTLVVQSADPTAVIQRLPIQRELSFSEIRSTRDLKMGSATLNLSAMLEHPDALPNVAKRLEASPAAVTVKAVDVNAFVVPQGLIVRSFLNYQIKPGACSDGRRGALESAGISCARRMSADEKVGEYSNPSSARYVADPNLRAQAIAKATRDWAAQDAETAAQVKNFRDILANPAERAKVASDLGPDELARLEALGDEQLAGELVSAAETKVEDVMFIPKEDEVDKSVVRFKDLGPRIPMITKTIENQPIEKVVFLTGFTLGRQYEWSKRIEKTIKWCWVGCAVTYYAGARAGFSYGFGLRFPITLDGNYRYEKLGDKEAAFLTATMTPVDGTPEQYAAAGLDSSQIFRGQEFVAELTASAGYEYSLPLLGSGSNSVSFGENLAAKLGEPYTNGHFTPPMPGTTNNEIPFVIDSLDLLMNYGNWGAAGIKVHPAVKVGLHSDSLSFKVHDNIAGTDQEIVNGKRIPLAIDNNKGTSNFSIRSPVYNLGFIVTPGINARAWIDVGVWGDSWNFPVWFPDIAITLPPGGIDFACHEGTICNRDYVYQARPPANQIIDVIRPKVELPKIERIKQ